MSEFMKKKNCGIICDFFFRKKKRLFFWNNLWNNCHVTIGYFFWAMASWQLAKSQWSSLFPWSASRDVWHSHAAQKRELLAQTNVFVFQVTLEAEKNASWEWLSVSNCLQPTFTFKQRANIVYNWILQVCTIWLI